MTRHLTPILFIFLLTISCSTSTPKRSIASLASQNPCLGLVKEILTASPIVRKSGVLMHITSLPSKYGIGDLGPAAFKFVDDLKAMKQRVWQILPIGPTGWGNSPYAAQSAFASNPLLISIEDLIQKKLLKKNDLPVQELLKLPADKVDYGGIFHWKHQALDLAIENFKKLPADSIDVKDFERFVTAEANWLDDYSIFMAIKNAQGGKPWFEWDQALKMHDSKAIAEVMETYAEEIKAIKIQQYFFDSQWKKLRHYANKNDISLIGDAPIFVAHDSADVWAHPELFYLDENRNLLYKAGVPPDAFSADGQFWGNPLYHWENHGKENFAWWLSRFKRSYDQFDQIRIDHFRGFVAYWRIPADAATATEGQWISTGGAGYRLFESLQKVYGDDLPVIAEDLGVITEPVNRLRDSFNFPGMKVSSWGNADTGNPYHVGKEPVQSVVYPFGSADNPEMDLNSWSYLVETFGQKAQGEELSHNIIQGVLDQSKSSLAIVRMQDILNLGAEGVMNRPGTADGNWQWRMLSKQLNSNLIDWMKQVTTHSMRAW